MTSKQIYEVVTIELSKIHAPTLKLYEFNYFLNQAIRQFVNKVYNIYDINQQTTDDLRVLKTTAILKPYQNAQSNNNIIDYLNNSKYFIDVPSDYLHILNCICFFTTNSNKCNKPNTIKTVRATKLTSDMLGEVLDDYYNKPSKKHPYYYIHNQNDIYLDSSNNIDERNSKLPTNIILDKLHINENSNNFNRTFDFDADGDKIMEAQYSSINKPAGSRYENASHVKIEIKCGNNKQDNFSLDAVQIDYIKAPQLIKLTQEQLDSIEDISQIMEFPEYVNQEIINELVNLIMRKTNDPSLQAHMQITQSIARPTGQQQ